MLASAALGVPNSSGQMENQLAHSLALSTKNARQPAQLRINEAVFLTPNLNNDRTAANSLLSSCATVAKELHFSELA